MGDVALSAPVIHSILRDNNNVEITFLSRGFFKPLFNKNNNFKFKSVDFNSKHKGLFGILKLFLELKKEKYCYIIDLHDVLRTKILRLLFKIYGIKTTVINKGRNEKNNIVTKKIPFKKLKHTQYRYLDAFNKANINSILYSDAFLNIKTNKKVINFINNIKQNKNQKLVGIAPFAAHSSKELGINKTTTLIHHLVDNYNYYVILFGGGKDEKEKLENISKSIKNCTSIVGKLSFEEELMLMKELEVMVAMDSGNMHLASLVNTKVVSIWGPTHPSLGFSPYNNKDNIVQVSRNILPCRPCSVYGKLKTKKDNICAKKSMENITIDMILEKII